MIKVFEMFAGYGGASFALKKAGIGHEVVGFSEIDKNAIKCYGQNFPDIKNYGDATQIIPEELPDFDLLTGGFPCQAFSIAGNRAGFEDTRGTLFFDIARIASVKKPKYMVLENVQGLLSHDDGKSFEVIIRTLKNLGYGVVYKVLNSADFGIPQSRRRIWLVCKYGGWEFMEFMFPTQKNCDYKLADLLETEVDKKYYLTEKQIEAIMKGMQQPSINPEVATICQPIFTPERLKKRQNGRCIKEDGEPMFTLNTQDRHGIVIHNMQKRSADRPSIVNAIASGKASPGGSGHLSRDNGIAFTIDTNNTQAIEYPNIHDPYNHKIKQDEICPTLTEPHHNNLRLIETPGIYRRFTPKECFRLMGFVNDEINLDGLSDSAKYKLAGNGWEINVANLIMKGLFGSKQSEIK